MEPTSLILGGTKGLGLALAFASHHRNIKPIIFGRSFDNVPKDLPAEREHLDLNRFATTTDYEQDDDWRKFFKERQDIKYIFWVAGIFERIPFKEMDCLDMQEMVKVHLLGPLRFLNLFTEKRTKENPFHLTVIASTSSWRLRENEALYCALKAAKAAFARNIAVELARDFPGSRVTLINPGGMKTPNFWRRSGQDISSFMEPTIVAQIIWDEMIAQEERKENFREIQILRYIDGSPRMVFGPELPEIPA